MNKLEKLMERNNIKSLKRSDIEKRIEELEVLSENAYLLAEYNNILMEAML